MGSQNYGIDPAVANQIAVDIAEIQSMGVETAIVIGGGNIFRGVAASARGMDRATADYMGMLATVINALALQDAPQQAEEDSKQVIVVTGSRIRKTDEFNTADPLTVITSDEITEAGFNSIGEALQSSQITQGGGQINNYFAGFVVDGGTGVNTVGLRGMGPERTLVLLNGRRLAPAGTRGSVGVVDLNVLPTAIVDRIDVFKAGASSVYGSDAVTGVINIVTDTKLKGLVLEAQGNLPEVGAGSYYRVSGSFGVSGERYRLIGSLEYYRRHTLSRNDVNWTKCPIGGYLSGEGTPFGSGDYVDPLTGQPKCFTLDNGGVTINTLGVPGRTAQDRLTGALGTYSRLVPDASVTGGNTPGYSGVSYYTRDTFDPRQEEEELVTPAKVITGFLQGGYDLDALGNAELYVELIGNRRESSSTLYRQLTLDYAQGSPLLPLMFRNGAFLAPNEISNGNIVAARSFIGFGNTKSEQRVDFFRTAGGLRGELPFNDWRYDFYTSYSKFLMGKDLKVLERATNALLKVTDNKNINIYRKFMIINALDSIQSDIQQRFNTVTNGEANVLLEKLNSSIVALSDDDRMHELQMKMGH